MCVLSFWVESFVATLNTIVFWRLLTCRSILASSVDLIFGMFHLRIMSTLYFKGGMFTGKFGTKLTMMISFRVLLSPCVR